MEYSLDQCRPSGRTLGKGAPFFRGRTDVFNLGGSIYETVKPV